MTGYYRMADLNICICSVHDRIHRLCADYRIEDAASSRIPADITIRTGEREIARERQRAVRDTARADHRLAASDDASLEVTAVFRGIAEALPAHDALLIHGSCIAADGAAYLFTAKSGTGKSTHTGLWRALLGERAVMVNDDKPFVRVTQEGVHVYGTPWRGKHKLGANCVFPLKAVCFLERAENNGIRPVSAAEAYPLLLQRIYRPEGLEAHEKTLALADCLAERVSLWKLGCNMDPEAAEIAYRAMKG